MNGILTALLGGASGVGQAVQYQNELGLKRNALDLEKAKMLADLAMQGMYQAPSNAPTSAPTMPTQPSGPVAAAPSTAPTGPPQGVLTGLMRGKDGFKFSQAAAAPPPQPSSGGDDILSRIGSAMPQQSLSLPGMGSFQYNPLNSPAMLRSIIQEAYKRKLETQGAVDVANQTGVTAEHAANTRLANRNAEKPILGEPGYAKAMGDVAGAEAHARLGADLQRLVAEKKLDLQNALQVESVRSAVQAQLQKNAQDFDLKKIPIEQKNALDRQVMEQQGQFLNAVGLERDRQTGEILPSITRGMKSIFGQNTAPPTTAPSLSALTPEQIARASSDPSYRAFLASKGYAFR